jgi:transposase-like protein
MSKARLIITAVVVEGRSKSEVARDYDVSRQWVHVLVARYRAEGEAAFEPRSRRPRHSPHAVSSDLEDEIVRLRKELTRKGLDAGADTIRSHLARRTPRSQTSTSPSQLPAVSTIWRILTRRGFVTPQPHKRPRSSWRRFAAEQPNERWQADVTHWQLADGSEVEILNLLDDHSRLALACRPRRTITGHDVQATFQNAFVRWGIPASVLTDNGAVFTGKQRGGGRVALEVELGRLGVRFDHSRPTTHRPAARSNGSSRPRRSGSPPNHAPRPSRAWLVNSPASSVTTTRSARTARTGAAPRPRPTSPAPRPPPPARSSIRTGEYATTASTAPAP